MDLEDVQQLLPLREDGASSALLPRQPGGRDFVSIIVDVHDSYRRFLFGYNEQVFFGPSIFQFGEEGEIYRLAFPLPGEKDDVPFPSVGFFRIQLANTQRVYVDTGLFPFEDRSRHSMVNSSSVGTRAACSSADACVAESDMDSQAKCDTSTSSDNRGTKRRAEIETEPPSELTKHFKGEETIRASIAKDTGHICFQINVGDLFKAASAMLQEQQRREEDGEARNSATMENDMSSMQLEK